MISNSVISSISLNFNDSWMAHMGSRVYRIALRTLKELFGNTFVQSQLCSGERLYRLVDAYRQSKRDRTNYEEARLYYTASIIVALKGERDPLEKTRKAKSILNTQVMGLSVLQEQSKASLSKHISYTLLPSLIEEFGKEMATGSILALHELDSMDPSKNDHLSQYVNLYRDIALQQRELDSFVEALDQLNSGISKDILINELLLSRNRNLSKPAKDKIVAILRSTHYIDIKLHKKMETVELARSYDPKIEFNQSEILSKLHENRNNQLEAVGHRGPSMFFTSDELESVSLDNEDIVSDTEDLIVSKNPFLEEEAQSTSDASSTQEILHSPLRISNTQLNCWYNSTLQILRNTPIYLDILRQKKKFSTDFPAIFGSFKLYQRIFVNQVLYPQSLSKSKIVNLDFYLPNIRKEAHNNLDKEFGEVGITQEDSQRFLYSLINKLSIPVAYHIWLPGEEIPSAREEKHLFLEKPAPSQLIDNLELAFIKIDLKTLFAGTDHQLYGIIFHSGGDYSQGRDFDSGHYFAALKMNGSWFLCNDLRVTKISEHEVEDLIQKNKALLIASRLDSISELESDMD